MVTDILISKRRLKEFLHNYADRWKQSTTSSKNYFRLNKNRLVVI